jgi:hypothetical protein
MSFDGVLLIDFGLFVVGAVAGVALRRRTVARRAALGVIIVAGIALALAIYVVTVGDPWQSGGTIPHYHMGEVLPEPFASVFLIAAGSLLWIGPLPIGFVIGTACAFRREEYGWLRLGASIAGGLGVFAGSLWMLVVVST